MSKFKNRINIVYSTNPDFQYQSEEEGEAATLHPSQQDLRILLDKKARAGKQVTLVSGFTGATADLEALAKNLKNLCGSGGGAKDGDILIQGDHRDKVLNYLLEKGYLKTKKSGG